MKTEQILIEKYGPLITLAQCANLLNRTTDGLRMTLRSNSDFSKSLQQARRKIGRRIYFRSVDVANLIDGEAQ